MNWRLMIQSWYPIYMLCLGALILQPSTPALWLGRYSNTSFAILIAFLVMLLPVFRIIRWLEVRSDSLRVTPRVALPVALVCLLALALIWQAPIGPTTSYQMIQLALVYGLGSVFVWLVVQLPGRAIRMPLIVAIVALGVLLLLLAADYPGMLWVDEGFMASLANGIRQTGTLHLTYYEPYEKELYSLTYVGLAYWYDLFGFSFGAGRIFIYVISLVAILIVFVTVRRRYSDATAWFVALLGMLAALNLNVYRQDVGVALLIATGLLFLSLAHLQMRAIYHLLIGLAFGFSLDGHPNAYRFSAGIGVAYLVELAAIRLNTRRWQFTPLLLLIAGGLAGVGLYIGLWTLGSDHFLDAASRPNFQFNLLNAFAVISDYLLSALDLIPLLSLTTVIGLVAVWRHGTPFEHKIAIIFVVSTIVLAIVFGYVRTYYLIHSLPVFLLLSAYGFFQLEQALRQSGHLHAVWMLILALLVASGGLLVSMLQSEVSNNYDAARTIARELRDYLTLDDRIVGADPLYFELSDYPHFADISVAPWRANFGDLDQAAVWQQIDPTAVVVFRSYPNPYPQSIFDHLESFDFALVQCWQSRAVGRVDLYRLDGAALADATCQQINE